MSVSYENGRVRVTTGPLCEESWWLVEKLSPAYDRDAHEQYQWQAERSFAPFFAVRGRLVASSDNALRGQPR